MSVKVQNKLTLIGGLLKAIQLHVNGAIVFFSFEIKSVQ
jgi:hypothetical protein